MTAIGAFQNDFMFWIRRNAPSQPGQSFAVSPRLRTQSAPPSPTQIDPAAALTSAPFFQEQPAVQFPNNINMNIPPTAKESVRPLQCGNPLFL